MSDSVAVATSGTVQRQDRCVCCNKPMLYRVEPLRLEHVIGSFCGSVDCAAFLLEIPE